MTTPSALAPPDMLRWPCPSLDCTVECPPGLLEKLCAEAVTGFNRLPHGGIEIGGILFGTRAPGSVRIGAARPISCEHRLGPSFILSENDQAALRDTLRDAAADPALASLEPLGCYFSHSRRGFSLADSDIALLNRDFPEPWQIALVLVPAKFAPTRAGVFGRDSEGVFVCGYEFHHSPPEERRSERPVVRAARPEVVPVTELAPPIDARASAMARFNSFLDGQERQRRIGRWNLAATVATLGLFLAAAGYAWWRTQAPATPVALPMRVSGSGNQLKVDWDPRSEPVQTATNGVLEIRDGESALVKLPVAPDVLRNGTVFYTRHSDRVELRLKLLRGASELSESVVYFINPAANTSTAAKVAPPKDTEASPVVFEKAVPPPAPRTDEPQSDPAPREADRATPPRTFHAPPARNRTPPSSPTLLPVAPDVEVAAAAKPVLPFAPAAPPPPTVTEPRKPSQPRSGRIIWTGELRRNALLSFSANGPSSGTINGQLPGGPVKVSILPAELIDGGIVVYSSSPSVPKAELPSARNGWNTVVYKYDPKRAADLTVVQSPAASNDWSQLVVRNGNRPLSVLVLDWSRSEN